MTNVGLDTAMSMAGVPSCEANSFSTGSTCGLQEKSIHSHTSAHSYKLLSCLFIATAAGEEAAVSVK